MGLSRLSNLFLSVKGNTLYVDLNNLDATDSIENKGNSPLRPFKSIQRALIEAARFSYQAGKTNDRFAKTTIVVYPGEYSIDNRPGWIPDGSNNFIQRNGLTSSDFLPFDANSNFDLSDPNNQLYKFNSIHGGTIVPRGVSIVGMDLRKTIIRPLYVPNPSNNDIETSSILRMTGACYFWQLTFLDANPNGKAYIDYTTNTFVPNFSHHKLTCYEYVDGVNNVSIQDLNLTYSTDRTDLEMYYEKIGIAYGPGSGRPIDNDYPSTDIDIEPKIGEYQIVGPLGTLVGISSIRAGDGVSSSNLITVTTADTVAGLDVDSAFQVQSVSNEYDGQFVVFNKIDDYNIQYTVQNPPLNPLPSTAGSNLSLISDTVTSSSPYIFNCSLKTAYGLCGLLADGDKASGFKSVVISQFTGIGLQKDDNAFIKYDETTGLYSGNYKNLYSDSHAVYKPEYSSFHIKAINDAYIQIVSTFAIGYANHFVTEEGGDLSINASNSNFGSKAFVAKGFKRESFPQDDVGYITHIIPPQEILSEENPVTFFSIDVNRTVSVANSSRLYIYNETNIDNPPESISQGYRLGAKSNDVLNLSATISGISSSYISRIVMPNNGVTLDQKTAIKSYSVGRSSVGINSITNNDTLTFTTPHSFSNGESIRVLSDNAELPIGLIPNTVYYAITSGVGSDQIKIAKTLNDSITSTPISLYGNGGRLVVESRVSDKISGDIGHPIQYDTINNQWYINVSTTPSENTIYPALIQFGNSVFGAATPKVYITRRNDNRNILDKVYRLRYVIPAGLGIPFARPPLDGFVIQESNSTSGTTSSEVASLYSSTTSTLSNPNDLRNPRYIANATWNGSSAYYESEIPHNLSVGSEIEILNIKSSLNLTGDFNSGYNGNFTVTEVVNSKKFGVSLSVDPGTFDLSQTANRTPSLPQFKKKKLKETLYVYRSQEVSKYIPNQQDGVYHLLAINVSNSPSVSEFSDLQFSQPIQNFYPQLNRDEPESDPTESISYALSNPIGQVIINDPQRSVTKEAVTRSSSEFGIGIGLTNIVSNSVGTAHTLFTKYDHGYAGITSVSISSSGVGYGYGSATNLYNAKLTSVSTAKNGSYATARVSVNASGNITSIKIIDGGSSYQVGDVLTVTGIATNPISFTPASIQVTSIQNNINDSLNVIGVSSVAYENYNTAYRITSINGPKEIQVTSPIVSNASTIGIGSDVLEKSNAVNAGKAVLVSSLTYNNIIGIATIVTSQSHGFNVGNKLTIGGASSSLYNGDFIVNKVNSVTSLEINVGVSTSVPSTSGTIYLYPRTFTSQLGNISANNENISGRMLYEYAGITTVCSTISSTTTDQIQITNSKLLNFEIGDYLLIDSEIVRIKSTVTSDTIKVFRGVLGTRAATHVNNSVVKRIRVTPIELRRNSIIRASGHTFEYLGFGPGNYSTALPLKQDRVLSDSEQLLALSTKVNGGITVYTGMDESGNFYVGNKKVNSTTGSEKIFDSPVPTVVGEDPLSGVSVGFDAITPLEISVSRSIQVEGGSDGNLISRFDGPVVFNNKITANSDIETNTISIQGEEDIPRKITIANIDPTISGNYGDVVFNSEPGNNGNAGWIYTTDNTWKKFGWINENLYGVGVSTDGVNVGLSTLLNITATNININRSYNSNTGITTLTLTATSSLTPIAGYAATAGIATYAVNAGVATYAVTSGIATYAVNAGVATYSGTSGVSTYSGISNVAFYANVSGIATYTPNAGVATYTPNSGIATYARTAGVSTYAVTAGIATYTPNAGIATYTPNAGIATYATKAGIATEVNNGSVTAAKMSGNQSGSAPVYGVRAWVNFNGSSGVLDANRIRSSGNISGVTRTGIGVYTITFTTPMQDTNYAVNITTSSLNSENPDRAFVGRLISDTISASGFSIKCAIVDASFDESYDPNVVSIMIIR